MFRFTNLVILRVTKDCNLQCKYCFMEDKEEYKGEIIEYETYKRIINQIAKQRFINGLQENNLSLVYHGGEPLLLDHNYLYKLLEYTENIFNHYKLKYNVSLQTNLTLLNDETAKVLQRFSVRVGFSFDGVSGGNKARTNIKEKAFIKKVDILKKNMIPYGTIIVIGKNNLPYLNKTKRLLESKGITGYKINYVEDMKNPYYSDIELSGKELFQKVWKPELKQYLKIGKTKEHRIRNLIEKVIIDVLTYHKSEQKTGCSSRYCGAGVTMIAVEPDGEMDFCDRHSKRDKSLYIQHALDYDFLGLHQLKKVVEFNRERIKVLEETGCDTCFAKYICEYGCTTFHYSKFGHHGIQKNLVCDQYKMMYNYILENFKEYIDIFIGEDKRYKISVQDTILDLKPTALEILGDKYHISLEEKTIIIRKK